MGTGAERHPASRQPAFRRPAPRQPAFVTSSFLWQPAFQTSSFCDNQLFVTTSFCDNQLLWQPAFCDNQLFVTSSFCDNQLFVTILYFVLDICCLPFGEYMSVEYICWYWIYHANTWGMTVSWRVSVCPSGTGLGMYIYENIYLYWIYAANHSINQSMYIFCNNPLDFQSKKGV